MFKYFLSIFVVVLMIGSCKKDQTLSTTPEISFDNFIELVINECFDLYKLVNSRFNSDFNPSIRRIEVLSDISESEFNLTMEKVSEGGGNFSLRFSYRGNYENSIYNFLKRNNIG